MKQIYQLKCFHWWVIKPNLAPQVPLYKFSIHYINIYLSILSNNNSSNYNDDCSRQNLKVFNPERCSLDSFNQGHFKTHTPPSYIYPQFILLLVSVAYTQFISFLYCWELVWFLSVTQNIPLQICLSSSTSTHSIWKLLSLHWTSFYHWSFCHQS